MRQLLMRVLGVPVGFLAAHALRLSGARVGIAALYHRIGDPPGDPERELVPALGSRLFARQLRHVRACYRAVPASELERAVAARRRGQRIPIAITFDDDLAGHVTESAPRLRRAGLTATFFLSGASLSGPFAFWWERLQAAADGDLARARALIGASPGRGDIHALASELQSMQPAERDAVADRLAEALGPDPEDAGLRATQVRTLVDAGFEIGFHTRHHDLLPILEDEALAAALSDGRSELEEVVGRRLEALAYPYGGVDARVAAAARDAGFSYGFTCQPQALGLGTDPLMIGRVEEAYDSTGRFALRLVRRLWAQRRTQPRARALRR
jgi:peptidoglycan/xylan/chitin deacetylase (PgdA/CDA1 family)